MWNAAGVDRGIWYAVAAYVLWGVLPLYWKALQGVPATQILAHRMTWSLVVVALLLVLQRNWSWLGPALRDRRTVVTFLSTGWLLALNWFVYIYGVNSNQVVETSLGYFINPLVNVLLGRIFLGERLRFGQGIALALATASVLSLTLSYGKLPWIALTLAASFGLYGLLRKTAPLGSLEGLTLETLLLFPFASAYLLYLEAMGQGAFGHQGLTTTLLLTVGGLATALPLLLFASGARRLTLATLGMLQYIAPSLQFMLGVFVYSEPLSPERLFSFALVWIALLIYTLEGLLHGRRAKPGLPE